MARAGAKVLPPTARSVRGGAHVGDTTTGTPRKIHFPEDLLRRHHLYVARTRMGKSTLMQHIVVHKMREKAEGRDKDAIVVVDPHADLVGGLLEHVPESLIDQVRLIDLADERGAPGVNLLDARIFADRDRTADSVVRVCKGLWDQWGPRMQSILEQTVKSLHEANESRDAGEAVHHPGRAAHPRRRRLPRRGAGQRLRPLPAPVVGQGLRQLAARDPRRRPGPGANPPLLLRILQAGAGHPGTVPLHHRHAEGHPRRRHPLCLHRPGHGGQGRGRPGGRVPAQPGGRRDTGAGQPALRPEAGGAGGGGRDAVDARRGLREHVVGAWEVRASFVLATQSLAKLDDLSRTMRDTLLANVGCLAVFQVAGNDARQLVWELGKERVTEDDITSLPVHQCYVRATVGTERMDAFSMKVAKPERGDPERADRIRALAEGYVTTAWDIDESDADLRGLVDKYRRELEKLRKGRDSQDTESGGQSQEPERRNQRTKRDQTGGAAPPETEDEGSGE